MPEAANRPSRPAWLVLAVAGGCAIGLAAAVAATGGIDWSLGSIHLRVREPWRLLAVGLALFGVAGWLGGVQIRLASTRAWDARDRAAGWLAAVAAAAAAVTGLAKGTSVAGGADAYGYVSQALLWLKGLPIQSEPLAARMPWPLAEWCLSPLGYRPGVDAGTVVPTYPPGLPLIMAGVAGVGGAGAVFWVVPLMGAAAVWLTYLLGRRSSDAASGAAAAFLLAASPVFLYQIVQPMSDVPATAWWLLSLWGAASGRPFVAGSGAAAAVMTRPNLAPAAVLVLAAVVIRSYGRHRRLQAVLRPAVFVAAPLAAAAAFLFWLNARLYGAPFVSGYGAASSLFDAGNVLPNLGRYSRWLLETQTPVVLLGAAAPILAWADVRRGRRPSRLAETCFGVGFIALVTACYLPYAAFEEWSYLRFLLPALPILLVLTSSVILRAAPILPGALRAPVVVTFLALLGGLYGATAVERHAFDLARLESRYKAAGEFAARELPGNAVLLSVQESGPLRLYGGRTTIRFDHLDPQVLDSTVQLLEREGRRAYFVLEAWEEAQFRDRFARFSALGLLDWPPIAEVGKPVKVRFYDPRDRRRFLAGETVATVRGPSDARDRR